MLNLPKPADARVVTVAAQTCLLELADGTRETAVVRGKLFGKDKSGVVVGDLVKAGMESEQLTVEEVLPRRNEYVRSGLRQQRQVMFANVDRVVIVASLARPKTKAASIDRFLVAAMRGGIDADLVLTKLDLDKERACAQELSELYASLKMPAFPLSNETGEGIDAVRELVEDGMTALIGNSGVGKSTLLNSLVPDAELRTREVSEWSGKGTHTTTASVLIHYGDRAAIVDTPGMKSFVPWGITRENLGDLLPEIAERKEGCKFRNCRHGKEPGCAVLAAVEVGEISPSRLKSYYRLLEEVPEPY